MAICAVCEGWDAEAGARFCGNCGACVLPLQVSFSHPVLARDDQALARTGASARLVSTVPVTLSDLALVLRREDSDAVLESIPIGYYRTGAKVEEKGAEPIPLVAVLPLAQSGISTTVSADVAADSKPQPHRASAFAAYLEINPAPPTLALVDEQVVWRPELAMIEVAVRFKSGAGRLIDHAELTLQAPASRRSATMAEDDVRLILDRVRRPIGTRTAVILNFAFSPSDVRNIRLKGIPLDAELTLFDVGGTAIGSLSFLISGGGPADPRLLVPGSPVKCLRGRRTRIGFGLQNDGGAPFHVVGWDWKLLHRSGREVASGDASVLRLVPALPFACASGECMVGEIAIRLPAPGPSFETGDYTLEIAIRVADRDEPIQADVIVSVVSPADLRKAYICIDFGTTESAAAILRGRDPRDLPERIQLGRVGFVTEDETVVEPELFIPTMAAASCQTGDANEDLDWHFGQEAARAVAAFDHEKGKLSIFQDLKWRLGSDETEVLPNGEPMPVAQIVSRYLAYLIDRLETHPDICGPVESTFITKPAIYRDNQVGALVSAFNHAKPGMKIEFYRLESEKFLISESWPPIYATIPVVGEKLNREVFPVMTEVERALGLRAQPLDSYQKGVNIITFDVGGGSLDVSLLGAGFREGPDGKRLHIEEKYNTTSNEFCGKAFSALIDAEVEAVLSRALDDGTGAQKFRDLHIAIQRGDGRISSEEALFNSGALQRVRHFFQSDAGAFWPLGFSGMEILLPDLENVKPRPEGEREMVRMLIAWLDGPDRPKIDPRKAAPRITLKGPRTLFTHRLTPEEIAKLLVQIAREFQVRYGEHLLEIFKQLALHSDQSLDSVILVTGRGSLFPIATFLIRKAFDAKFGDATTTVRRASGMAAKWITAVGGALIGCGNRGNLDVDFYASVVGRYAAIVGRSIFSDSGGYKFKDFTPDVLDKDHPIALLELRHARGLLHQEEPLPIIRRFNDSEKHEVVIDIDADALLACGDDNAWLAIRLGPGGRLEWSCVVGDGFNAAAAAAAASTNWTGTA